MGWHSNIACARIGVLDATGTRPKSSRFLPLNTLAYWLVRGLIAGVQSLPLATVAWLGRVGAHVGWWIDRRHRGVAIDNLTRAFGGGMSATEIHTLARENYLRLGVNYLCLVKTASMSAAQMQRHLEWSGLERLTQADGRCGVIAIGHFGNFELFERLPEARPDLRFTSTYRALRQPLFDDLMQEFRTRFGMTFFERRAGGSALKGELANGSSWLVLLADQHAGAKGVWLPFLGRDCACSASPAVMALRYQRPLLTAICYWLGPTRWRIEIGEEIPTRAAGRRRSVEAITRELNAVYETAIRRAPANWFWVHRRWKPPSEFQGHGNARHGAPAATEAD